MLWIAWVHLSHSIDDRSVLVACVSPILFNKPTKP